MGPLRQRDFRLFFAGQTTSLLGDGMVGVALAFAVLDLTNSAADLGYVLAAASIPLVAFLLVGGVFADRLERRAVMVGADTVRFATQGVTAALLISGHATLWELIVLQVVRGAASAFFNPSLTGLTPLIVAPEGLQQANALRGISSAAGNIIGPVTAGALVATAGPGWALAVDSGTFAVSGICLLALHLPPHERLPPQRFLTDLREGWREFSSRTWLWSGVTAAGIVNMMAAPFFVLGAVVSRTSYNGAGSWALILAAFGVGSFAGGLLALRLRPRRPFQACFIGYLWFGVPSLLLAFEVPPIAVAASALVAGAGLLIGNALWETTLQQQIPAAVLSRVTSYDWFGSLAGQPLGNALIGPCLVVLGMRATLLGASAVIAVANVTVLSLPSVRAVTARTTG